MKTNYLQNISIALNQSFFFSSKAWMRHSRSGKKSWLYSLASSQGDIIYFFVVCQIIQENHNRVLIQRLVTHGQLAISLLHWKRSFWMYIFLAGLKFYFLVPLPLARSKGTPLLSAPNVSQTVSSPLTLTQPPPFLLGFFRKKNLSVALTICMLHQTLRLQKFEPESLLWPWIQVLLAEVATHCDYQSSTKKTSFTTFIVSVKSQTQSPGDVNL